MGAKTRRVGRVTHVSNHELFAGESLLELGFEKAVLEHSFAEPVADEDEPVALVGAGEGGFVLSALSFKRLQVGFW